MLTLIDVLRTGGASDDEAPGRTRGAGARVLALRFPRPSFSLLMCTSEVCMHVHTYVCVRAFVCVCVCVCCVCVWVRSLLFPKSSSRSPLPEVLLGHEPSSSVTFTLDVRVRALVHLH